MYVCVFVSQFHVILNVNFMADYHSMVLFCMQLNCVLCDILHSRVCANLDRIVPYILATYVKCAICVFVEIFCNASVEQGE